MDFALLPVTAPGQRLVTLAVQHADDFATRADRHDQEASFPFENIAALQHSGLMAACVPEVFGGMGITSLHDAALAINRLARGDASTAIATTMHLFYPWRLTRTWQAAQTDGDNARVNALSNLLQQIGSGTLLRCALLSESGTDLTSPRLAATRASGGWHLNGRKIFGTMAEAAQLVEVSCCYTNESGSLRRAIAAVPAGSAGMRILQNWDALGMRASGSHDVVFSECFVPNHAFADAGAWGEWSEPFLTSNLAFAMGLAGAFLGIAEAARDSIVGIVTTRHREPAGRPIAHRPAIQHIMAEIEIDLAACRAMLGRTMSLADTFFQHHPAGQVPLESLHQLMKDFQCAKWMVTQKAVTIVDRALTLSGGLGYLNTSPLARLYRDVRAGPFMQPFSPNEAFEYIGKVTLGMPLTEEP